MSEVKYVVEVVNEWPARPISPWAQYDDALREGHILKINKASPHLRSTVGASFAQRGLVIQTRLTNGDLYVRLRPEKA